MCAKEAKKVLCAGRQQNKAAAGEEDEEGKLWRCAWGGYIEGQDRLQGSNKNYCGKEILRWRSLLCEYRETTPNWAE